MTTVELLSSWLNCSADWITTVGEDIVADDLGRQTTSQMRKRMVSELDGQKSVMLMNNRQTERQSSSGGAAAIPCP